MPIGRAAAAKPEPQPRAAVEWIYFAYLLFAPLGATAMAAATYRGPDGLVLGVLWLAGAVAIAIYAAFVITYLVAPTVWWRVLLVILDGPLWIVLAAIALHGWDVLALATWFFVAESLGVYLAIAIVAVRKLRRDAGASVGIMLACAAAVCFAAGWALVPKLVADGLGALMFAAAIVQSTAASVAIVDRDRVVRGADTSAGATLVALGLFHVAIGAGVFIRFVVLPR